jgi:dihydroorotase
MVERVQKSSRNVLVRGGRIIDPSRGIDGVGDLLIVEDRIAWAGLGQSLPLPGDCLVVHAEGMAVCPGFVDVHCHLRQPGFEAKETIATGTRAAARGGFTTVCCMPNTEPPLDSGATVEFVRRLAAEEGAVRVLPVGCLTKGRKGSELADFGELLISGAVAFSDDGDPLTDEALMRRALEYSRESGAPVIDHCEDLALSGGGVMNEGDTATRLGLKGIPPVAEESAIARDIELARATGGRLHIAHVTTAGSVELIRRAKDEGVPVTAEATPHHLTLTEEAVAKEGANAKVNPPLRTAGDVAALVAGLREGVVDMVATDHAPHSARDKACDFEDAAFGISGLETALGSLMGLVHRGEIDLAGLVAKLTVEPARLLRRPDLGTLEPGTPADIVVCDPDREWVVSPDGFASKGRNTPLAGQVLKGAVALVVYGGAVVFRDERMPVG